MHSTYGYSSFILLAYFNFPDINWDTLSASYNSSKDFVEICQTFHFSRMITQPTRKAGNAADLLYLFHTLNYHHVRKVTHLAHISDPDVIYIDRSLDTIQINAICKTRKNNYKVN